MTTQDFPGAPSYDSPDGHIHIKWQHGPIKEHGVNGVQADDVLNVLIDRLRDLNQPPFACRENSLAITKLEEAGMWLRERTRKRQQQGVEGTNTPHIS